MPHIAAAGIWLGLDVVVAGLVFTARGAANPATAAFCFRALEVLVIWPMALAALDSLVTGVLLGMGSKYGLLRYWWVAVKLAMNLLLTALVIVLLRPGLHQAADYGRLDRRRPVRFVRLVLADVPADRVDQRPWPSPWCCRCSSRGAGPAGSRQRAGSRRMTP